MTIFQNKAISASAGSGKTFRLAHRYMGLLARGVLPDRICALTFSRKAAGEIFESIMRHLTKAVQNQKAAELSCAYMEAGAVSHERFSAMLRCFVENLHNINLGTIDGFIVGIVRAFPLELGLNNADFNLMDNDSADAESFREGILAAVFGSKQIRSADANIFLEAFRQATLGAEKKTFTDNLEYFLGNYRQAYLCLPSEASWGNSSLIWKTAPWWLERSPMSVGKADCGEILRMIDEKRDWSKRMRDSMARLIGKLGGFNSGSEWEPDVFLDGKIQSQIVAMLGKAGRDDLRIEYANKEYLIPDKISRTLRALYHNLFRLQFERLLKKTGGIFKVMELYENRYEKALVATGNMTFTDAQLLLSPHGLASGGITLGLSRAAEAYSTPAMEDRLFIDYRLDSETDHFLLDEFQDTSNLQWQVLENLADEILQNDSGTRSFFYVGDTKQTIYRWRGGNPDLFHEVLKRYGKKIINEPLNETQRSAQPIVDAVNRVFSHLPEYQKEGRVAAIPEEARRKWEAVWRKHACGRLAPNGGYAALLRPVLPENADYHDDENQFESLARLLKRINPAQRGLSTAILVRKNTTGRKIADYLRQNCPELNISYEGETVLLDSPVVTLLLDLLRYAEHPADNFAMQHIMMSPLGRRLIASNFDALSLSLLQKIQSKGFKAVIHEWAARLGHLDHFGNLRLSQMLEIAGRFDVRCDRNIPLFIRTVETFGVREASEAKGCIHVMTVHQSKGLGFDLVILPDLNANEKMNSAGSIDFLTGPANDKDAPPWLLAVPDRKTAECDATLKGSLETCDARETLDNLCLLYVAMTRAKKALYMLTRIRKQKYFNLAAFLEQQLGGDEIVLNEGLEAEILYEAGDRNWFGLEKPFSQKKPAKDKATVPIKTRHAPLERIEPSLAEDVGMKASWLFNAESREVLQFGSAIHELFSEVEWGDSCDPDEIILNWKPDFSCSDIVLRDVKAQFRQVLSEPEIKKALSKPDGKAELWREKSFDVILDNKWISGIFDRVVVLLDAGGKPLSAQLTDYKSNRTDDPRKIEELARVYLPQMSLYRLALSNLLNLPEEKIETFLFFTVPRKIVRV